MVRKRISLLFIAGGLFFIILAVSQIYRLEVSQSYALSRARELVKENGDKPGGKPTAQKQDIIGILRLPSIKAELPVIKGTSEDDLLKGVGHYEGTAMPGEKGQMVLSGHRDTVFKKVGKLSVGDELKMETPEGTYTYTIDKTYIVEADDRTVIKDIVTEEVLTLTTCYPFSFIGDAPQRYIVNAKRKV
ncbi:class D sortase [Mesobacillus zeae]|uniref:class D sortase n=1 Tax=Mesobacillus zeae TaxID=1917180 RepID=UPI00300B1ADB